MLREFFYWWFGQLTDLLPSFLRRTAPTAQDAMVIAPVGPIGHGIEAVAVGQRRNGKETPLGHLALGPAGVAELPRAAGRPIVLRLGQADVLGKTVSFSKSQVARGTARLRELLGCTDNEADRRPVGRGATEADPNPPVSPSTFVRLRHTEPAFAQTTFIENPL